MQVLFKNLKPTGFKIHGLKSSSLAYHFHNISLTLKGLECRITSFCESLLLIQQKVFGTFPKTVLLRN